MKKLAIILLSLGFFAPATFAKKGDNTDKFTPEQLAQAAQEKLKTMDHGVAIWVNGLVCKSCAIGIRKKIRRQGFVDQKLLNKGVDMDPDRMLVYIAIKKDHKADFAALAKAIKQAGYLPKRTYHLVEGEIKSADLKE